MRYTLIIIILSILSCAPNTEADLIIINANIYTVDGKKGMEAIAIENEKIIALGSNDEIEKFTSEGTTLIDAKGNFVMPGFIEGHGHFHGIGKSIMNLNFLKSKNWDEIVSMVKEKVENAEPGEWIEGRGWHQEKWNQIPNNNVHGYPFHSTLSEISPDNPVILYHASGHSLFANEKAMSLAGVSKETNDPKGGEIVRNNEGEAVGVFEERAMKIVREAYNSYLAELSDVEKENKWYEAIDLAQQECLQNGITSFQDAGSKFSDVVKYKKLAEEGKLNLRLWAMIRQSSEELNDRLIDVKAIDVGNGYFTCRAIKTELDGALGSYGAWLLEEYNDKENFVGQNTTEVEEVRKIAKLAIENDMQLCVHAIGDRANREVLDICQDVFEKNKSKTDLRWRMEHAQHINVDDIPRFKELGIIASMQAVHCTSDAPFVEKRLGEYRSRTGAYVWRSLLDAGVVVTNGTDAPVEDVSPIESYYASVTRKRIDNGMEFFPHESMSREEAIKSYTLDCAYSAFEEEVKGSLEIGKYGDVVILSNDIISCTKEEILETEVLYTIVGGKVKYQLD